MDCSRDEALRAKSLAEEKFATNDFASAKIIALKAHNLFPRLTGISQLLKTIDVYLSAETKISGEVDWYGVLGLDPSTNEEAIKKQYRKLALMLHPDKNKSAGANGAFAIISEAHGVLSDKIKRLAYDQKRAIGVFQQKASMPTSGPSPSAPHTSTRNGFFNSGAFQQNVPMPTCGHSPSTPHPSSGSGFFNIGMFQRSAAMPTHGPSPSAPHPSTGKEFFNFGMFQQNVPMPTHGPSPSAPHLSSGSGIFNFGPFQQKVSMPTHGLSPSAPHSSLESGFFNFSSKTNSTAQTSKNGSATTAPPAPAPTPTSKLNSFCQGTGTFWTTCYGCKMQYKHHMMYINHTLFCITCKAPYLALATPPPQNFPKSSSQVPMQHHRSLNNHVASQRQENMSAARKSGAGLACPSLFRNENYPHGPLPGKTDYSFGASTVHMDHEGHDNWKRSFAESSPKEEIVKKRKLEDCISGFGVNYNGGPGNGGSGNANSSASGST